MSQILTFPRAAAAPAAASRPMRRVRSRIAAAARRRRPRPRDPRAICSSGSSLGSLERTAEIAGMLVALRMKGETAEEMIGAAQALARGRQPFDRAGLSVRRLLRHGRRFLRARSTSRPRRRSSPRPAGCRSPSTATVSFTSKCGSADVLEALGARLDLTPARIARDPRSRPASASCSRPPTIPGMQHAGAGAAAAEGPDDHEPARPVPQSGAAAGAAARRRRSASCFGRSPRRCDALGVERALVVHGSGLDEVALHGFTQRAARCRGGELEELEITPEEAGLERAAAEVRSPAARRDENARGSATLLDGRGGAGR